MDTERQPHKWAHSGCDIMQETSKSSSQINSQHGEWWKTWRWEVNWKSTRKGYFLREGKSAESNWVASGMTTMFPWETISAKLYKQNKSELMGWKSKNTTQSWKCMEVGRYRKRWEVRVIIIKLFEQTSQRT